MKIEDSLHEIREELISLYPDAVSIDVTITASETSVIPHYRTDLSGYSMQNVRGEWVRKANEAAK